MSSPGQRSVSHAIGQLCYVSSPCEVSRRPDGMGQPDARECWDQSDIDAHGTDAAVVQVEPVNLDEGRSCDYLPYPNLP